MDKSRKTDGAAAILDYLGDAKVMLSEIAKVADTPPVMAFTLGRIYELIRDAQAIATDLYHKNEIAASNEVTTDNSVSKTSSKFTKEGKLKYYFDVRTIEQGHHYQVPQYQLAGLDSTEILESLPSQPLDIKFVRGSVSKDDNTLPKTGTLHEHLLVVMIQDLRYKNALVPSTQTTMVIQKLEEAYDLILERKSDRTNRGVLGTYEK